MQLQNFACAKRLGTVLLCLSAVFGTDAIAASKRIDGKISRILSESGETHGVCMVVVDKNVNTLLPACKSHWISFSCSGTFAPTDYGREMFNTAKSALIHQLPVSVYVDDTRKHNGYCFAYRIDVNR